MPELKLISLKCHSTDDISQSDDDSFDSTIEDEPYLLVDHKRVWGSRGMKSGDIEDLSGVVPIAFTERTSVELWDEDASERSDDDQIGMLTVHANLAGLGELTHEFKSESALFFTRTRKKARYTLRYEVI